MPKNTFDANFLTATIIPSVFSGVKTSPLFNISVPTEMITLII
jgi:hypothetical protein